jgi:hypothetical protein
VRGVGCRVEGFGCKVQGVGCRVQGEEYGGSQGVGGIVLLGTKQTRPGRFLVQKLLFLKTFELELYRSCCNQMFTQLVSL